MKRLTASAVLLSACVFSGFCSAATGPQVTKDQDYWRDMEASSQGPLRILERKGPAAAPSTAGRAPPVRIDQPAPDDQGGLRAGGAAVERTLLPQPR